MQKQGPEEGKLKYITGEWFYEVKSQRHQDRIHGSDIIMASMKKTKPMTVGECRRIKYRNKLHAGAIRYKQTDKDNRICSVIFVVMFLEFLTQSWREQASKTNSDVMTQQPKSTDSLKER